MSKEPVQEPEGRPESEAGTREKIIAAALNEFAEHGEAGARVDRIAAAAGINKAMIYYHFRSKDDLYLHVLKSFYHEVGKRAHLLLEDTTGPEGALRAVAELHAGVVLQYPQARTMLLRELADPKPEIIEAIADSFRESGMLQLMKEHMADMIHTGRLQSTDPRQIISAFVSLSLGYYILYPIIDRLMGIKDRAGFIEERKRVIVDIFLNGIKA